MRNERGQHNHSQRQGRSSSVMSVGDKSVLVSSYWYNVSSYFFMCPHATIYVPSCYYICVFILLYMYSERQKRPSVMRAGDKSVGSIKALFRLYPGCIKGVLSLFCFYRREHWPGLLLRLRCLDVHSSQSGAMRIGRNVLHTNGTARPRHTRHATPQTTCAHAFCAH